MNKTVRYYCIMRPPMIGAIPNSGLLLRARAYEERHYVPEIDRMAWGWLEYDRELTPGEIADYELIRQPREREP